MRPISKRVKKILQDEDRMKSCELCGSNQVEWAHIFQYAGRQIDEAWNIMALCKKHHDQATPHKNNYKPEIRDKTEWLTLARMSGGDLMKYHKKDWKVHLNYLSKKAIEYEW